jgi:FAD/FMN-containing dehydrogenase
MPTDADVLSALRAQLPENVLLVGDAEREAVMLDALGPQRGFDTKPATPPLAVIRPSTTEQVATVVRVANQHVVPVVPYGGGTGLMGGARSVQPGIVLDLKAMNRIREIDPDSGWVWVEAGAVLADVNRELAPHGLMLGHDPWTFAIATIGGTISTNGLGFLGGKYGSMGQQVLALEVVLADGSVLRTRSVQPHSTGVDLNHLFIAAEGSLGIITAAAVRTFPVAEASIRLGYRFETFEAGLQALLGMHRIGLAPAILDFGERTPPEQSDWWEAQPPTLYVGFLGVREEVDGQSRRASEICARGGTPIEQDEVEAFWNERHVPAERFASGRTGSWPGGGRCFDYIHVALPVPAVLGYRTQARAIADEHRVDVVETGLWVHAGLFSMVLVTSGEAASSRMSQVVDACLRHAIGVGGSVEYCHGVGVRLAHLMREEHGVGLDVMRAVKRALDPTGILNPGKMALDD